MENNTARSAMIFWLLVLSLLALLASLLFPLVPLLGLSAVTLIVSLVALRVRRLWLLLPFWVWLNGVFFYLEWAPDPDPGSSLWWGLPAPAFWMLLGIWIIPLLIWPLGFALTFRDWRQD